MSLYQEYLQAEQQLADLLRKFDARQDNLSWEDRKECHSYLMAEVGRILEMQSKHDLPAEELPNLEVLWFQMNQEHNRKYAN